MSNFGKYKYLHCRNYLKRIMANRGKIFDKQPAINPIAIHTPGMLFNQLKHFLTTWLLRVLLANIFKMQLIDNTI